MTDPKIPVTEDELHAYVDNELPAERRGDVEAWLAAHPDDAARVQSWRARGEGVHGIYGAIAATLVAFIGGSAAGWLARGATSSPSVFANFTEDALDAHRLYVVE